MGVSAAQKAYRQRPEEIAKRRAYAAEYRKRAAVKARNAEAKRKERAAPGGAEINRERVKADRKKLGRGYVAYLVQLSTGLPQRAIPETVVRTAREILLTKRLLGKCAQNLTSQED